MVKFIKIKVYLRIYRIKIKNVKFYISVSEKATICNFFSYVPAYQTLKLDIIDLKIYIKIVQHIL